jgi:hypothetical protein
MAIPNIHLNMKYIKQDMTMPIRKKINIARAKFLLFRYLVPPRANIRHASHPITGMENSIEFRIKLPVLITAYLLSFGGGVSGFAGCA